MQRIATSDRRRARTLAGSLAFVLVAAALYAHNVKASTTAASQHPSDSHGISTLATTAQRQVVTTAWTSLRVGTWAGFRSPRA